MTKVHQINYYYDTPDMLFRMLGITVRTRQKEGVLKETVKKHQIDTNIFYRSEDNFAVVELPMVIKYVNAQLFLMGQVAS